MTASDITVLAYLVTLLCVVAMEVYPRGRLARVAAIASIACVTAGSAAAAYVAYCNPTEWQHFNLEPPAAREAKARKQPGVVAFGNNAEENKGAEDARGNGAGGAPALQFPGSPSGSDTGEVGGFATKLGLASNGSYVAEGSTAVRDCSYCPPLIPVPAGESTIGADDRDTEASAVERPATFVRFWPGFLIGAAPVTAAAYSEFEIDTNRQSAMCGGATADLSPMNVLTVSKAKDEQPAKCVSARDADAYAAWLTARTGLRFRLPTAAEWEYAARVLPGSGLKTGDVAEIVADCWHSHIPAAGSERIAAQTGSVICDGRTLKSGGATEPASWHRFSARRQITGEAMNSQTGFRVMRALDGVH